MSAAPVSTWTVPGRDSTRATGRLAVLLAGICQMSRGDAGQIALLTEARGRVEFTTDTTVTIPDTPGWACESAGRRRWTAVTGRRGYELHLMEAQR